MSTTREKKRREKVAEFAKRKLADDIVDMVEDAKDALPRNRACGMHVVAAVVEKLGTLSDPRVKELGEALAVSDRRLTLAMDTLERIGEALQSGSFGTMARDTQKILADFGRKAGGE